MSQWHPLFQPFLPPDWTLTQPAPHNIRRPQVGARGPCHHRHLNRPYFKFYGFQKGRQGVVRPAVLCYCAVRQMSFSRLRFPVTVTCLPFFGCKKKKTSRGTWIYPSAIALHLFGPGKPLLFRRHSVGGSGRGRVPWRKRLRKKSHGDPRRFYMMWATQQQTCHLGMENTIPFI